MKEAAQLLSVSGPNPPYSVGLRYKHLEWTCSGTPLPLQATVKRPTGSSISFHAAAERRRSVSGGSRKLNYRVRLLNQDKSPCTDGNPIYLDIVPEQWKAYQASRLPPTRLFL